MFAHAYEKNANVAHGASSLVSSAKFSLDSYRSEELEDEVSLLQVRGGIYLRSPTVSTSSADDDAAQLAELVGEELLKLQADRLQPSEDEGQLIRDVASSMPSLMVVPTGGSNESQLRSDRAGTGNNMLGGNDERKQNSEKHVDTNSTDHIVTEQSVERTDGHGYSVTSATICDDGDCKTSSSTQNINAESEFSLSAGNTLDVVPNIAVPTQSLRSVTKEMTSMGSEAETSFREASDEVDTAMQTIQETLSDQGITDALTSIYNPPLDDSDIDADWQNTNPPLMGLSADVTSIADVRHALMPVTEEEAIGNEEFDFQKKPTMVDNYNQNFYVDILDDSRAASNGSQIHTGEVEHKVNDFGVAQSSDDDSSEFELPSSINDDGSGGTQSSNGSSEQTSVTSELLSPRADESEQLAPLGPPSEENATKNGWLNPVLLPFLQSSDSGDESMLKSLLFNPASSRPKPELLAADMAGRSHDFVAKLNPISNSGIDTAHNTLLSDGSGSQDSDPIAARAKMLLQASGIDTAHNPLLSRGSSSQGSDPIADRAKMIMHAVGSAKSGAESSDPAAVRANMILQNVGL